MEGIVPANEGASAIKDASAQVDVSVIIPTYNDAKHLKVALASIPAAVSGLSWEAIVADDQSTDNTEQVVRRFARRPVAAGRIHYIQMPTHSGAAGAPRNRAIASATGRWVTMLDSDDVLTPGGIAHLVDVAGDAQLVLGSTQRRFMLSGKTKPWMPTHYKQPRVVSSILDAPDLVGDTNSTATIYRHDLLATLHYREGVRYEDLDFTTRALITAAGIVVTPETVYEWRVYPPKWRTSITQQREDVTSLQHRMSAFAEIDAFLSAQTQQVQAVVADEVMRKFLRHDVFVYLSDAMRIDDDLLSDYVAILAPKIALATEAQLGALSPMKRATLAMVLAGDLDGIRLASQYDRALGALGGCITADVAHSSQGGTSWESPAGTTVQIGPWPVRDTPWSAVPILHWAESLSYAEHSTKITGASWDALGVFGEHPKATLIMRRYERNEAFAVAAALTKITDSKWQFTAEFDLPHGLSITRPNRWDAWLVITGVAGTNASRIRAATVHTPKDGVAAAGRDSVLGRRYGWYSAGFSVLAMKKVLKHRTGTVLNAIAVGLAAAGQWCKQLVVHTQTEVLTLSPKTKWIGQTELVPSEFAAAELFSSPISRQVIVVKPRGDIAAEFSVKNWIASSEQYLIVDRRHLSKRDPGYGPSIRRVDAPWVWEIGAEGLPMPPAAVIAEHFGTQVVDVWPIV